MQLSRRQQTILADMGIPVWQARASKQPTSSAKASTEADKTLAIEVEIQGHLVLVMDSIDLDEPQKRLLSAMLQAAALDESSVTRLTGKQLESLPSATLQDKAVLILGETLAAQYLDDHNLNQPSLQQTESGKRMACYSLSDMLQDSMCKAAVWQALKQLKMAF